MSVAVDAVTLLLPFLTKRGEVVADKVGEAAWQTAEKVYQSLKSRFDEHPNSYYASSLQQFEEAPEEWQEAFQGILAKFLKEDPAFAQTFQELLKENGRFSSTFSTNVFGGSVGQIINAEKIEGSISNQPAAPQPSPAIDLAYDDSLLRQSIADGFNKEELTTLAYEMKLNPQSFPDRTLPEMITSLVDYCRRHGRIPELIQKCCQRRSHLAICREQTN